MFFSFIEFLNVFFFFSIIQVSYQQDKHRTLTRETTSSCLDGRDFVRNEIKNVNKITQSGMITELLSLNSRFLTPWHYVM